MKVFISIKERWEAYLKRLAKANTLNYGDNRLDCCALNRMPYPIKQSESTEPRTKA